MSHSTSTGPAFVPGPVLLLGAPGVGKGTQAQVLMGHFGIPQISTGDLLRSHRSRQTELGLLADGLMKQGRLVPDDLVNQMVERRLSEPDAARGYILDGFPRTLPQAAWLDALLADLGPTQLPVVAISITVHYDELLRRITGRRTCPSCKSIYNVFSHPPQAAERCDVEGAALEQRSDDTEEVFAERMKTFAAQTAPVVEHYRALGRFEEVNGERAVETVTAEIEAALRRLRDGGPVMAILIKSPKEIERMRRSGRVLRQVHDFIAPYVRPGASTMTLETAAVAKIAELGAVAAFKGYHGFPAALCTSINDEVVHGIPSEKRILRDGDVISIDCGVIVDGFYSDAAVTYAVGQASPQTRKLLEVTKLSLEHAILQCKVGGRLGDISAAVQDLCEAEGFGVVREFVGHGIGKSMHEDPQVPNFGDRGTGPKLKPGMVLAIEPMINAGGPEVRVLEDGWTAVTVDGSYSAHFEHTVAITNEGPLVLTR